MVSVEPAEISGFPRTHHTRSPPIMIGLDALPRRHQSPLSSPNVLQTIAQSVQPIAISRGAANSRPLSWGSPPGRAEGAVKNGMPRGALGVSALAGGTRTHRQQKKAWPIYNNCFRIKIEPRPFFPFSPAPEVRSLPFWAQTMAPASSCCRCCWSAACACGTLSSRPGGAVTGGHSLVLTILEYAALSKQSRIWGQESLAPGHLSNQVGFGRIRAKFGPLPAPQRGWAGRRHS